MTRLFPLCLAVVLAACGTSSTETYERVEMPEIGNYGPPPADFQQVRVGVMKFKDKTNNSGWHKRPIGENASEQFQSLLLRTNRFQVVERTQLDNIVKEQSLAGVVDPDELARPGRVRGVEYLWVGAITNFRVKVVKSRTAGGIFDAVLGNIAPVDIDTSKTVVETQVGVDLRLVNTTTGTVVAGDFGEVNRKDTASAWGVRVFGIGGDAKNELHIDADSQGRILRWALDESLQKMLPTIDQKLSGPRASACPSCKTEVPAGKSFCPKCGKKLGKIACTCGAMLNPSDKFCGKCGAKAPGSGGGQGAAPAPAPAPAPAAGPADYLPANLVLAREHPNSVNWAPAIMSSPPAGEKKQAEFTDARDNKKFMASQFAKTRPATKADIKAGAAVFVMWDTYRQPDQAKKRWKNAVFDWQKTTVTSTEGLNAGVFQAPVSGASRDVHVSNARVPVK